MNKLPNPTLCGAVLGFGLLASGAVFAQASTGAIEGDAVAGDSVTIRNIRTEHSLAYAVAGKRFHFGRLPVGIYEVVIHHADGRTDAPILARARLGETVQVN
jgi:hypothetical protein